ncbi:related to myosin tail region-interacting protein MTI1 [Rhynchosporium secalis]|uniref:Related to myosin tail region-interacting protein MTI1 n=1 Tax=Rhynchosporium secalis TaxID=38038 RepID=A0A1E1LZP7_RHYSE|nr:related to myosin tail region-interacting protein MTI1 [Rhynchosporium secalis]
MASLPFKVKAVFEYTSPHEDDLYFPNGQIITVTAVEDDDWYAGEYTDASGTTREGIFPKNFVEKYEPTAPPRPTRAPRPKKEPEQVLEPKPEVAHEPSPAPQPAHEPQLESEQDEVYEAPVTREPPPSIPEPQSVITPTPKQTEFSPIPATAKPIAVPKSSAPPPVSDKPSGGSFRDRIAAFNKAAPPPAPFKPSGLGSGGSNNFIKKPFVAPPPSKNAYVPVIRDAPPQKVYRREEDPEVAAVQAEAQEQAERAGLAPTSNEGDEEEPPKPTSLKERIALLQKQQMEQASRHADAAQKKEKPKRPVKKRTESHDQIEGEEEAMLERQTTEEPVGKLSMDSVREEPKKRKASIQPRQTFGDGNEADMSGAGDTTEEPEELSTGKDDGDKRPRGQAPQPLARAPTAPLRAPDVGEEDGAIEEGEAEEEEEEEEEDDIDPEVRRKEELRARMAKMSGGMGMHGMFGGGMPMPAPLPPRKKKSTGTSEKRAGEYGVDDASSPTSRAAPPVPLPGLSRVRSPEETNTQLGHDEELTPISASRPADEVPDVEDIVPSSHDRSAPPLVPQHDGSAPSIPGGRPAPPPVPQDTRPITAPMSPSAGSESDDEMSSKEQPPFVPQPIETPRAPPRPVDGPGSPKSPIARRASYFGSEASPASPTTPGANKRNSRLPPPIPGAGLISQASRAPPPPPPGISRAPTGDQNLSSRNVPQEESEGEVTEYDGDYDTDIASTAPHKDALKAAEQDQSLPIRSPTVTSPISAPPPLPPLAAPRAVHPPLPAQPTLPPRQSVDAPRAVPPPPPQAKVPAPRDQDDDEFDPYKIAAQKNVASPGPALPGPPPRADTEEDLYSASPPRSFASPIQDRPVPPPPSGNRPPPRQSLDVSRSQTTTRRSVELGRMSMDSGFVANDVDLAPNSLWWTQPKGIPPVFQGRRDIQLYFEESTAAGRGGRAIVTKHLSVLFQDYSQTIITAEFDAQDPKDVSLEQRHDQPPSRQRQDQLEQAHEQYGRRIFEAVYSKKETVVGDGTPQGLIQELLKPFSDALLPIGSRAYGAIIYSNLANASTQQNDEIRAGDIITLRNTKFQGKHGPMHAKYSMEVGKPDHVGVVAEWDGTKKKVRAWEQGRESKKVKLESFKLDDLRSGEVKIWRVMPRSWVGWHGPN